jgi:predicted regulator of Ras-like GTPase activity (Roadblock/LC7/MglB family)
MKEILQRLNGEVGITGSMVITPDGIMVSAALGEGLEEDRVAAIVSSLLVSVRRCLLELKTPGFPASCVLNAQGGKILFFDMGNAFLVVVADRNIKLDAGVVAIQSAIHRIKNRRVVA